MDLDNTQRRFAIMGENAFLIANKLMKNQRLCRLLKYQTRAPFSDSWTDPITKEVRAQPEVQGEDLINKQIPSNETGEPFKNFKVSLSVKFINFIPHRVTTNPRR